MMQDWHDGTFCRLLGRDPKLPSHLVYPTILLKIEMAKKKQKPAPVEDQMQNLTLGGDKKYAIKIISDIFEHAPQPLRIYFSFEEMKSLKLLAGDFLMIHGDRDAFGICWPSRQVDDSVVGVSPILYKNLGEINSVTIEKFKGSLRKCDLIQLFCAGLIKAKEIPIELVAVETMIDTQYAMNNQFVSLIYDGLEYFFQVQLPVDNAVYVIDRKTIVKLNSKNGAPQQLIEFKDIGGLDKEIAEIRKIIRLSLFHAEIFTNHGLPPPKGILLSGPPGTGKSMVGKALRSEFTVISVRAADLQSKLKGEMEQKVNESN